MKKIIIVLLGLVILSSCSVTYYSYYEVDGIEETTVISKTDAEMNRSKKTPTRCVGVYIDRTGQTIYLMETEVKEKLKNDIDYD